MAPLSSSIELDANSSAQYPLRWGGSLKACEITQFEIAADVAGSDSADSGDENVDRSTQASVVLYQLLVIFGVSSQVSIPGQQKPNHSLV